MNANVTQSHRFGRDFETSSCTGSVEWGFRSVTMKRAHLFALHSNRMKCVCVRLSFLFFFFLLSSLTSLLPPSLSSTLLKLITLRCIHRDTSINKLTLDDWGNATRIIFVTCTVYYSFLHSASFVCYAVFRCCSFYFMASA